SSGALHSFCNLSPLGKDVNRDYDTRAPRNPPTPWHKRDAGLVAIWYGGYGGYDAEISESETSKPPDGGILREGLIGAQSLFGQTARRYCTVCPDLGGILGVSGHMCSDSHVSSEPSRTDTNP